ncbi:MAG: putative lipoprotein, partial [Deltaproteobacteria bacterium]|nr:putative lipoprotein [Deltaproteobacteria bacterium]
MKAAVVLASTFCLGLTACGPAAHRDDGLTDASGSGSGTDSGSDTPRTCNKMDIVFVIDDSGSMQEEQTNLAANFPMFADLLANYTTSAGEHIDFRVAVTTTGRDMDYTILIGAPLPQHESGDNGA